MAFLVGSMDIQVYTDSAQTDFPTKFSLNERPEFADSAITEVQTTTVLLAPSGSQTINFNGVGTVRRFFVFSDTADITVNMNSLGALTCKAGDPGWVPFEITSMVITNASASLSTTVTVSLVAS
jgi:hypothetical protein